MRDCVKHSKCTYKHDQPLPTRILDIGKGLFDAIVLHEPLNRSGRYICLSYCWGGASFINTTRENIIDHKKRIPWEMLPKTFQDAIQVTRRLGIEYIWIDALCIIQDDYQDWEKEAGEMATVYQNSFMTIAATSAKSPHDGLFSTSSRVELESVYAQLIHHFPNSVADGKGEVFPLLSRAWTYQERMLASRVLHFGPEEISWECFETRRCECGWGGSYQRDQVKKSHFASTLSQSIMDNDLNSGQPQERIWRQTIVQYSPLALTFASDRLPALSGLAEQMRRCTNWTYLAGLWKENLPLDLLWYLDGDPQLNSSPVTWRAPSWSWASLDGPIMYYRKFYVPDKPVDLAVYCKVLGAECTIMGQSLTGRVTAGYIKLACSIVPVSYSSLAGGYVKHKNQKLLFHPDRDTPEGEGYLIRMISIIKLPYGIELFLVVRAPDADQKTFTRVGLSRSSNGKSLSLPWSEETEITIV
ncbi:HET-domain-containing protein [Stipitochalara longipes BDJ]|nr:HET-domain-containing protein [Stipitochalara longipes BDJ]